MDGSLRVAYLAIKKYTTEVVHITSVIVLMLFTLTAAMLDCTVKIGGAFQAEIQLQGALQLKIWTQT